LGILGEKGGRTREFSCRTDDCARKRAPKRAPSIHPLLATGACTLKRTGGRLSVQAQFQHLVIFVPGFRGPTRAL